MYAPETNVQPAARTSWKAPPRPMRFRAPRRQSRLRGCTVTERKLRGDADAMSPGDMSCLSFTHVTSAAKAAFSEVSVGVVLVRPTSACSVSAVRSRPSGGRRAPTRRSFESGGQTERRRERVGLVPRSVAPSWRWIVAVTVTPHDPLTMKVKFRQTAGLPEGRRRRSAGRADRHSARCLKRSDEVVAGDPPMFWAHMLTVTVSPGSRAPLRAYTTRRRSWHPRSR